MISILELGGPCNHPSSFICLLKLRRVDLFKLIYVNVNEKPAQHLGTEQATLVLLTTSRSAK